MANTRIEEGRGTLKLCADEGQVYSRGVTDFQECFASFPGFVDRIMRRGFPFSDQSSDCRTPVSGNTIGLLNSGINVDDVVSQRIVVYRPQTARACVVDREGDVDISHNRAGRHVSKLRDRGQVQIYFRSQGPQNISQCGALAFHISQGGLPILCMHYPNRNQNRDDRPNSLNPRGPVRFAKVIRKAEQDQIGQRARYQQAKNYQRVIEPSDDSCHLGIIA